MRDAYRKDTTQAGGCKCGGTFTSTPMEGTAGLLACTGCDGTFVTVDLMKKLLQQGPLQRAVLSRMPPKSESIEPQVPGAQRCPVCEASMESREHYVSTPYPAQLCSDHGLYFESGILWRVLAHRHERLSAVGRRIAAASDRRGPFGIPSGVFPIVAIIVVLKIISMLQRC